MEEDMKFLACINRRCTLRLNCLTLKFLYPSNEVLSYAGNEQGDARKREICCAI